MTRDESANLLHRLETGFKSNAESLKVLEEDLSLTMEFARGIGNQSSATLDWRSDWQTNWDEVRLSVRRIHRHLIDIRGWVVGNSADHLAKALAVWEEAQLEDAQLLARLRVLRIQAAELESPLRKEWNRLARRIEEHLELIHTSAQALRVRLELLKSHSAQEVDKLVNNIHSMNESQNAPNRTTLEPFDRDYRTAALQREQDQHDYTGLFDLVKGLSLWVESPEERMRKNRSLTLEEA
jgi:hypothetical protein